MVKRHWIMLIALLWLLPIVTAGAQEADETRQYQYAEKLMKDGLADLAALQYQQFLTDFPGSPKAAEVLYKLGEAHFASGEYASSRKAWLRLVIDNSESSYAAEAQFRIAESYEKAGKPAEAAENYYRLYAYYPEHARTAEALLRAAVNFEECGKVDRAERLYRQITLDFAPQPQGAEATFALARLLDVQGKTDEALALCQKLIDHPVSPGDDIRARRMLLPMAMRLGRWTLADEACRALVADDKEPAVRQDGLLGLAQIALSLDDPRTALTHLAEAGMLNGPRKSEAMLLEAEVKTELLQEAEALERLGALLNQSADPAIQMQAAVLSLEIGKTDGLDGCCLAVLNDSSLSADIHSTARLCLARSAELQGRPQEALRHYSLWLPSDSDVSRQLVRLKKARLYIESLSAPEAGLATLRELMADFPLSDFQDHIHWLYGSCAAETGFVQEARRAFDWLLKEAPFSELAPLAEKRLTGLSDGVSPDWIGMMDVLSETVPGEDRAREAFSLGKALAEKGYWDAAAHFLTKSLGMAGSAEWSDEARLLLAYTRGSQRPQEAGQAYSDAVKSINNEILKNTALAHLALYDTAATASQLAMVVQSIEPGELRDRLMLKQMTLQKQGELEAESDSLLNELWTSAEASLREPVLSLMIDGAAPGDTHADSLIALYQKTFPRGPRWPEFEYRRLCTQKQSADWRSYIYKVRHTVWADSARLTWAEVLMEQDRAAEAETALRNWIDKRQYDEQAHSLGLLPGEPRSMKPFIRLLAQACLAQNKLNDARLILESSLSVLMSEEDRLWGWEVLADLSERQMETDRAVWYRRSIFEHDKSDSTAMALAQLYFRSRQYDEARKMFADMNEQKLGDAAFNTSGILTCLLRQGQAGAAQTGFARFKQIYKKEESFKLYEARYYLERGKTLSQQKRFEPAVEALKEAAKSKQASVVPEAEIELGRTYLIMANIDEALKILTEVPGKYPGHPALPKAYFYMAQHYENSKQYPNAAFAYRWVVDNETDAITRKLAMRKLIESYEKIGQLDAAMAATRRFIRAYPNDSARLDMEIKIGLIYKNLQEYDRAIEVFQRLRAQADPDNEALLQYSIGDCYASMGRWEEAVFEFLKVSYLSQDGKLPWKTTALYKAGDAYLKLRETEKARLLFQQVIRRDGAEGQFGQFARKRIEAIDAGEVL